MAEALRLVEDGLLEAASLQLPAARYFDTLTASIEAVNALGGQATDALLAVVQDQAAAARRALGLPPDGTVVALLPGSRAAEIEHLASRFFQAWTWPAPWPGAT